MSKEVRDKIIRFYRSSGDDVLAAQLCDAAEGAIRSRRYRLTDFIDPHGLSIAETVAAQYGGRVQMDSFGGYQGAERVRVVFQEAEFRGEPDYEIEAIEATWDDRFVDLTHRDVQGSLLATGISRDVVGDILFRKGVCQILLAQPVVGFVLQNWLQIGRATISVKNQPLESIVPREERVKELRATVASLRLDSIASSGFGTSRSRMADDIAAGKVKVNWQETKGAAQTVKVGDVISIRGRGRVEFCEISGNTKKGRIGIVLKRYL